MLDAISRLLDWLSNFLAVRKGLLPILGIGLILINLVFQFIPGAGFLAESNLFLHIGAVVSILGIMLAWAL
ncbi:MAG: hypothetical protein FVQ83_15925 [Chloroflexi bacterium]|nr:hypothetical protein [Chloroflexota bacterium]